MLLQTAAAGLFNQGSRTLLTSKNRLSTRQEPFQWQQWWCLLTQVYVQGGSRGTPWKWQGAKVWSFLPPHTVARIFFVDHSWASSTNLSYDGRSSWWCLRWINMLNSWSDILVTTGDEQKHEKEKRKKKNPLTKKLEDKEEFQTPKVCRWWWRWIGILHTLSDILVN